MSSSFGREVGCSSVRLWLCVYRGVRYSGAPEIAGIDEPGCLWCLDDSVRVLNRARSEVLCVGPQGPGDPSQQNFRHRVGRIILNDLNQSSWDEIIGGAVLYHLHLGRVGRIAGDLPDLLFGWASVWPIDRHPTISFSC